MNHSWKVGFSFGITSGIITTLGLMVGLNASTHSKLVVLGGILTIAIADSLSDAMSIHVTEESENKHSSKEIWQSTISTFLSKFLFTLSFIIPVLLVPLTTAIIISIIWGLSIISIFTYFMAKKQKKNPLFPLLEHLTLVCVVILLTHLVGLGISKIFGGI